MPDKDLVNTPMMWKAAPLKGAGMNEHTDRILVEGTHEMGGVRVNNSNHGNSERSGVSNPSTPERIRRNTRPSEDL